MKAKKLTALLMTLIMLVSVCSVFAVTVSAEATTADTTWYTSEAEGEVYTLTTPAQFLGFIQLIQAKKSFEGQTVKLGADIDLTGNVIAAKKTTADSDGGTMTTGAAYAYYGFVGTLDGQNYKVTGIQYDYRPGAIDGTGHEGGRVHDAAIFGSIRSA